MAIDKRVNVIISAVDRYGAGLNAFKGHWGKITSSVIATSVALTAVSMAMAKITVDIAKNFVTAAADFHDAIYNVEAVASSFGTTSGEISKILTDLTIKFPLTGAAAGEALELIAQMGYGSEEQLRRMSEAAVTLQIATGADLQTAAQGTMATMNAFGLEIENAERVMNLFAAAHFTSAANVSKLTEAMKYAGPAARLVGMAVEDTVAIIAQLVNIGLEGSQAGTTFRMAMTKVFTETDKGNESLAQLGISYKELQDSTHSATAFIEVFGGQVLTAKQSIAIFGTRAQTMSLIINKGADAFNTYRDSISGTTAAADAMEKKMRTWNVVTKMVEGDMDVLKKTIGDDLLNALIDVIGIDENSGIRGVITQIRELEEEQGLIGGPLVEAFNNLRDAISGAFKDTFTDVEGFYDWLGNISILLSKNIELLGVYAIALGKIGVESTNEMEKIQFYLTILNQGIGTVSMIMAVFRDIPVYIAAALKNASIVLGAFLSLVVSGFKEMTISILEDLNNVPFFRGTFDEDIARLQKQVDELAPSIQAVFSLEWPESWMLKVGEAINSGRVLIADMGKEQEKMTEKVYLTVKQVEGLGDEFEVVDGQIVKAQKTAERLNITEEEAKLLAKALNKEYMTIAEQRLPEWARGSKEILELVQRKGNAIKEISKELEITADNVLSIAENYDIINDELIQIGDKGEIWQNGVKLTDERILKIVENMKELQQSYDLTTDNLNSIREQYKLIEGTLVRVGETTEIWYKGTKLTDFEITSILEQFNMIGQSTIEVVETTKELKKTLSDIEKHKLKLETTQFTHDLKMIEQKSKQTHEITETALEWGAKIDIAGLEAGTKRIEAMFDAATKSIGYASEASSEMFGSFMSGMDKLSIGDKWFMQDILEDQMSIQRDSADSLIELTKAQTNLMVIQAETIKKDGIRINVKIQENGEDWLAGLLNSLLDEVFIKAESEGFQCFGGTT